MEKLLEDLHADLKQLNINYAAHATIEQIIAKYKQKVKDLEK